jgi:uncharacterized protein YkwD
MQPAKHSVRKVGTLAYLLAIVPLLIAQLAFPSSAHAQQDATLFRDELKILYLVNLQRREAGLPPLAWNAEMTEAARWFARDAIEAMGAGYCGHTDSLGRSSGQRIRAAGYTGQGKTAENSMCGYMPPEDTVRGWMKSTGHRANILDPGLREAGAGYYRNAGGSGYAVLDLGADRDYAPVVINDEALTTTNTAVRLYLYDQDSGDGWGGVGQTVDIMVANTPDFTGAQWEPYTAEKDWSLEAGEGWRTVYVKTRDRLGQITIVRDAIYLGDRPADDVLALEYATQVDEGFTLRGLPAGYSHVQFSLNWQADDSDEHLDLLEGQGERINDAAAVGGSAFRLIGGSEASQAWTWNASPFGKAPAVAYFRLKVADNSSAGEVATLMVNDGKNEVARRALVGADFAVAGQYQEFAVPFTPSQAGNGLILLFVRRSSATDVLWDATSFYTPPVPFNDPLTLQTPNQYYRSSGVQVRLVTPGAEGRATTSFSDPLPAYPHLGKLDESVPVQSPTVRVSPTSLGMSTPNAATAPPAALLALTCTGCGSITWQAVSDVAWLTVSIVDGQLRVVADPTRLTGDIHYGAITLTLLGREDIAPITLPVTLLIGDPATMFSQHLFLPAVVRR